MSVYIRKKGRRGKSIAPLQADYKNELENFAWIGYGQGTWEPICVYFTLGLGAANEPVTQIAYCAF